MEKSLIQSMLTKFDKAGITSYGFFCRGGNWELRHNGKDCLNLLGADVVLHIEYVNGGESVSPREQYEVDIVPYENIDYMYPIEVNNKETKDLITSLGLMNDDVKKFLENTSRRYVPNTHSRSMTESEILNKDGSVAEKPLSGKAAYIVEGAGDRIVGNAIKKS